MLHHDQRRAVDDALHLESEGAHRARVEVAHALDRNGLGERPLLDMGADLVELHTEPVGQDSHNRAPHQVQREVEEHRWRDVHRTAEADQRAHRVGLVVERVVEDLLRPQLGDVGAHAGEEEREDVAGPPGVDAGGEDRRVAGCARLGEPLGHRRRHRGRVVHRVEGRGDDVGARPEHGIGFVERLVGPKVGVDRVDDTVDIGRRGERHVVGGCHTQRLDVRQLPDLDPDLGRVGDDGADELELVVGRDRTDRRSSDVARAPHDDAGHEAPSATSARRPRKNSQPSRWSPASSAVDEVCARCSEVEPSASISSILTWLVGSSS